MILAATSPKMDTMPNVMERFQWFTKEISSTNVRLMQLGMEAEDVVKEMEQMFKEAGEEIGDGLKQFKNVVINAKKGVICGKIEEKCRSKKRCRYWNRGYCREGSTKCPFYHPPDDCQQHLAEGHCSSQGCGQRHRKRCKYWGTKQGCFRKGQCQYLHIDNPTDVTETEVAEVEQNLIKDQSKCNLDYEKRVKETNIESNEPEEALQSNCEIEASQIIEMSQNKLSCEICNYKCKTDNLLKKHLNSNHEGHLKCPIGENRFSTAASAFKHATLMHDILNPNLKYLDKATNGRKK